MCSALVFHTLPPSGDAAGRFLVAAPDPPPGGDPRAAVRRALGGGPVAATARDLLGSPSLRTDPCADPLPPELAAQRAAAVLDAPHRTLVALRPPGRAPARPPSGVPARAARFTQPRLVQALRLIARVLALLTGGRVADLDACRVLPTDTVPPTEPTTFVLNPLWLSIYVEADRTPAAHPTGDTARDTADGTAPHNTNGDNGAAPNDSTGGGTRGTARSGAGSGAGNGVGGGTRGAAGAGMGGGSGGSADYGAGGGSARGAGGGADCGAGGGVARVSTRGLCRFGLPELDVRGVRYGDLAVGANVLRGVAVGLLAEHLARPSPDGPVLVRVRRFLDADDVLRFFGRPPRRGGVGLDVELGPPRTLPGTVRTTVEIIPASGRGDPQWWNRAAAVLPQLTPRRDCRDPRR
ncbi:hypothetical protein [Actinomadura atramentaria]|uniref:hypothetical protein n=1 Tax=Actinomadura atramentaria TaxID=1990 RepID=UPI0003A7B4D3|nr:hypothetical protein [Actinomadura atramentaria]